MTRVIDHNGQATVYEYDALGNRSAVRYPNGNVMTYTYDACQRLKEERVTNAGGVTLAKYTYGTGKAGEHTSITELNGGVETETTYKYDRLNRLVKETIERDGNRLTNELNQLVSEQSEEGNTVYTYDDNENLIRQLYQWQHGCQKEFLTPILKFMIKIEKGSVHMFEKIKNIGNASLLTENPLSPSKIAMIKYESIFD